MTMGLLKPLGVICGCIPQRYVLSFMCCMAALNAYTMRVALNIAITVMVRRNATGHREDPDSCPADDTPLSSHSIQNAEFEWDEATQGLLLSAFYWGYVLTHIPGGMIAARFGGKYTLLSGIMVTAIGTLLTPLAARAGGSNMLLLLRFIEGLGEGTTFPAVNVLLAHWCPSNERSRHASLAFAGALIGNVIGHSLSGLVLSATDNDWPTLFYMFGLIAVGWCLLFGLFCYSDPASHPYISAKELAFLEENIEGLGYGKDRPPTPWKAVLTSIPLWGLIVAQIGHDWIFFTMVTDLPKYMNDVMKFNVKQLGFFSSLPYLAEFLVSLIAGWAADKLIVKKCLSITNTRKLFAFIASFGPCVGVVAASYAGCDRTSVVALFTFGMGIMGTFYPGIKVNALDLSPNFAGLTLALVNGIGAMSGIVVPYLIGLLTPDSTLVQWRTVFWITAAVTMVTNIVFSLTASGEVQPWNYVTAPSECAEEGKSQPAPGREDAGTGREDAGTGRVETGTEIVTANTKM